MAASDRQKWDEKYSQGSHAAAEPSVLITELADLFPQPAKDKLRAIDVAGGAGRHALWLAQQGFDTTLADVSLVALSISEQRAHKARVSLRRLLIDIEEEPFPAGPWDVIVDFHFLSRPLFQRMIPQLAFSGVLIVVQPTMRNLERHPKPSAEYLLAENELRTLVPDVEIVRYDEGWLAEGRHEARLVAKRLDRRAASHT